MCAGALLQVLPERSPRRVTKGYQRLPNVAKCYKTSTLVVPIGRFERSRIDHVASHLRVAFVLVHSAQMVTNTA
eukprot:3368528-Pyramimonas_sp.AAC.2